MFLRPRCGVRRLVAAFLVGSLVFEGSGLSDARSLLNLNLCRTKIDFASREPVPDSAAFVAAGRAFPPPFSQRLALLLAFPVSPLLRTQQQRSHRVNVATPNPRLQRTALRAAAEPPGRYAHTE